MEIFLLIVCGAAVALLFGREATTRGATLEHEGALRALAERVAALEDAAGRDAGSAARPAAAPTPSEASIAALTGAAPASPAARPVDPAPRAAPPRPAPPRPAPRVPARAAEPGLGEQLAAHVRTGWDQWIAQNLLAAAGGVFVLLGASFFVAVAISNGWLTPWRQVVAALVVGGLLLAAGWRAWPADATRRAAHILAQTLVGTGGGVMLLGIVAGARIYDPTLYPAWIGLVAAGAVSAVVVTTAVRWRAQVTAALGMTTAIAAPLLVDAPMKTGTVVFLLLALAGSAVVIAVRGWPWLLQVAIVASCVQVAAWAIAGGAGDDVSSAVAVTVIVAWWALLALPALLFETRADTLRLRLPTSTALFQVAGLAAVFARLEFGSVEADGFAAVLCILAGLHLVTGAVMLRLRPGACAGAIFVWAIGAALAAGAAAVLLGGAARPAFWAVETLAMLWLYVRFGDRQAGLVAGLLGALTLGNALYLAPPAALAYPLDELATGALALLAATAALALSCVLLRDVRRFALALAVATWAALLYLVGVVIVGEVAPTGAGAVDQAAQLCVTGAWAALATAVALGLRLLPTRHTAAVRTGVEVSLIAVAAKALLIDSFALGMHDQRLLWLLGGLAVLAALLAAVERALPAVATSLPLAAPFAGVLLISGITQPGLDAYRAGSPELAATLGMLALAIGAAAVALWRHPARSRPDALVAAVVLVTQAVCLATVTLLTPVLGESSERAQRAVSVAPLLLALALIAGALLIPRVARSLQQAALGCAGGLLLLAAILAVGDTAAFGATALALGVAACWLAATAGLALAARARPELLALAIAVVGGVAMCAFTLFTIATPDTLAFGAVHGWWVLAAGALATAAAVIAAVCLPARWRTEAVATALALSLYTVSVLVVTALTPAPGTVEQVAQLALSLVWGAWGVALLGAGVTRRTSLGLFLRRAGIALTGLAAVKVLIIDTARFDTAHRAGVFLALGAILLAGAWAYARLARRLDATAV